MCALLFYTKLVADLEGDGFVINPYDPCVANMTINNKWETNDRVLARE